MKKRVSDQGINKFLATILGFFGIPTFFCGFSFLFLFLGEVFLGIFFSRFWAFFGILGLFLKIFLNLVKIFRVVYPSIFFQDLEIFGT